MWVRGGMLRVQKERTGRWHSPTTFVCDWKSRVKTLLVWPFRKMEGPWLHAADVGGCRTLPFMSFSRPCVKVILQVRGWR